MVMIWNLNVEDEFQEKEGDSSKQHAFTPVAAVLGTP